MDLMALPLHNYMDRDVAICKHIYVCFIDFTTTLSEPPCTFMPGTSRHFLTCLACVLLGLWICHHLLGLLDIPLLSRLLGVAAEDGISLTVRKKIIKKVPE